MLLLVVVTVEFVLLISPQAPMEETTSAIPTGSPLDAPEAVTVAVTVPGADTGVPTLPPTPDTLSAGSTTLAGAGGRGDGTPATTVEPAEPAPATAGGTCCCPFSGLTLAAISLGEVAGVSMPRLSYLMLTGDGMGVEVENTPLAWSPCEAWMRLGEMSSVAAVLVVVGVRFGPDCCWCCAVMVKLDCGVDAVSTPSDVPTGGGGGGGVLGG